jgi:hypothetical protein
LATTRSQKASLKKNNNKKAKKIDTMTAMMQTASRERHKRAAKENAEKKKAEQQATVAALEKAIERDGGSGKQSHYDQLMDQYEEAEDTGLLVCAEGLFQNSKYCSCTHQRICKAKGSKLTGTGKQTNWVRCCTCAFGAHMSCTLATSEMETPRRVCLSCIKDKKIPKGGRNYVNSTTQEFGNAVNEASHRLEMPLELVTNKEFSAKIEQLKNSLYDNEEKELGGNDDDDIVEDEDADNDDYNNDFEDSSIDDDDEYKVPAKEDDDSSDSEDDDNLDDDQAPNKRAGLRKSNATKKRSTRSATKERSTRSGQEAAVAATKTGKKRKRAEHEAAVKARKAGKKKKPDGFYGIFTAKAGKPKESRTTIYRKPRKSAAEKKAGTRGVQIQSILNNDGRWRIQNRLLSHRKFGNNYTGKNSWPEVQFYLVMANQLATNYSGTESGKPEQWKRNVTQIRIFKPFEEANLLDDVLDVHGSHGRYSIESTSNVGGFMDYFDEDDVDVDKVEMARERLAGRVESAVDAYKDLLKIEADAGLPQSERTDLSNMYPFRHVGTVAATGDVPPPSEKGGGLESTQALTRTD